MSASPELEAFALAGNALDEAKRRASEAWAAWHVALMAQQRAEEALVKARTHWEESRKKGEAR